MPLILGMDFLVKASPSVNWKEKKVTCYVGTKSYILPTCSINDVDNVTDANSFAGLMLGSCLFNLSDVLSYMFNLFNYKCVERKREYM